MAGLILAFLEGLDPAETLKLATGCALAALDCPEAVSRTLSRESLAETLSRMETEVLL